MLVDGGREDLGSSWVGAQELWPRDRRKVSKTQKNTRLVPDSQALMSQDGDMNVWDKYGWRGLDAGKRAHVLSKGI